MSDTREQFSKDLHRLVGRYSMRIVAPEMVGAIGYAMVDILTSCPAEKRMEFAEGVFAHLLRQVRESLQ